MCFCVYNGVYEIKTKSENPQCVCLFLIVSYINFDFLIVNNQLKVTKPRLRYAKSKIKIFVMFERISTELAYPLR